ncbi:MAG: hypothetical protein D6741_06450 [Planctomycetota bacterium]|nr:MAG: hypothetical protein D6741_06450 [Planctomycetota bacterium]
MRADEACANARWPSHRGGPLSRSVFIAAGRPFAIGCSIEYARNGRRSRPRFDTIGCPVDRGNACSGLSAAGCSVCL